MNTQTRCHPEGAEATDGPREIARPLSLLDGLLARTSVYSVSSIQSLRGGRYGCQAIGKAFTQPSPFPEPILRYELVATTIASRGTEAYGHQRQDPFQLQTNVLSLMYTVITLTMLCILGALAGFWGWAVFRCAHNPRLNPDEKGRWMLLIFLVPVIGAAIYHFKHQYDPIEWRKHP